MRVFIIGIGLVSEELLEKRMEDVPLLSETLVVSPSTLSSIKLVIDDNNKSSEIDATATPIYILIVSCFWG